MVILCTIDLETREVSLPAGQVIASYDHNVDVIRFQAEAIPGFSLDTSSIKIAAQGPNNVRHDYAVDPSTVAIEEETGYITFDWPIPAGVTEMPLDVFKYGDRGQLIFAVCAEIISGSTVSKAWHSDDGIITVVAHLEPESGGGEDPSETATNAQKIGQLQTDVAVVQREVSAVAGGTPTVVDAKADMTEHDKIYILSSDGKWYYYSATAEDWLVGGVYGGAVTDTTLSVSGAAADAKAVGDALALKADSSEIGGLSQLTTTAKDNLVSAINEVNEVTADTSADVVQLKADLNSLELGELPKTIIKNSYVAITGEIIAYNGWDRTAYIPVNKYYSIVAKSSVLSNYNVFFDGDFNKIGSNFTVGTTDTTVLVPPGAKYVIFSNTAAGMQDLITHYTTKTENTVNGINAKAEQIDALDTRMTAVEGDVSDLEEDLTSNYVVQGYKTPITSSNYISLLPSLNDADVNKVYRINGILQSIANIPANDSSTSATLLTFSSTTYSNKSWYVQLLATTSRAMYYRSCWAGSWTAWNKIVGSDDITAITTAVNSITTAVNSIAVSDNLRRKYFVETSVNKKETNIQSTDKIITFGDSITKGTAGNGCWVDEFCAVIGCTAVNRAVVGGLFGHEAELRPEAYWISTQIDGTTSAQWEDCKVVFVAAGTNDAGYSTTNSELADKVQSAITTIKANTNAHIVFITPIRRGTDNNATNMKLPLISGIIENIALANGCSVICGFNFPIPTSTIETYIANFTAEGLHPNQTGSKVYAQSVINAIY